MAGWRLHQAMRRLRQIAHRLPPSPSLPAVASLRQQVGLLRGQASRDRVLKSIQKGPAISTSARPPASSCLLPHNLVAPDACCGGLVPPAWQPRMQQTQALDFAAW